MRKHCVGTARIDGKKLADLTRWSEAMGVATTLERTVIAVLAEDVEQLKEAADAKLMLTLTSLALLETYQAIFGINDAKAESKADDQKAMALHLNQALDINVKIGDSTFVDQVKDVIKSVNWIGDELAINEKIVAGAGD